MAIDPYGSKFHQQMVNQAFVVNQAIAHLQTQTSLTIRQQQSSLLLQAGPQHPKPIPSFMRPDPKVPDTMGWRVWIWQPHHDRLASPVQGTLWNEPELIADNWNDDNAVRGVSGIHARLVPRHWKDLGWPDWGDGTGSIERHPSLVTGIVERFGKYVLGTEGWRAEWVVIRELMAPSTEIGLKLEKLYPDVIVHYPEEEGEQSCTSETLLKSEKGSRPTNRPRPPSPGSIQSAAPSQNSSLMMSGMFQHASPTSLTIPQPSASPPDHPLEVNNDFDFKRTDNLGYFGALIFWGCVLSAICIIARIA